MEKQPYLDRTYLLEKLKQAKQSHTIGIYREKITKIKSDAFQIDGLKLNEITLMLCQISEIELDSRIQGFK